MYLAKLLKEYLDFSFFPHYSSHFCTQLFAYLYDYFFQYVTRCRFFCWKKCCYLGKKIGIYQMKDLKLRLKEKEIRLPYEGWIRKTKTRLITYVWNQEFCSQFQQLYHIWNIFYVPVVPHAFMCYLFLLLT